MRSDRLIPDVAGDGVARADVVIEAIFENVDAKRSLFAAVEARAKPGAILATNTSSIPLENIATAMADPTRLIGLHFFNPVAKMMLVEIVRRAADAAPSSTAPAAAFVRQIDRLPLPVKSAPGFLVNRVLAPYLMAAMRCVDEGIAPGNGRRGGARVRDADGPDRARRHRRASTSAWRWARCWRRTPTPPKKLDRARRRRDISAARPSAASTTTRAASRRKQAAGAAPAGLADRLIGPFVAEAKAALAEGIVADADLVDAGAMFGTGFAPFRGGPAPLRASTNGVTSGAADAPAQCRRLLV